MTKLPIALFCALCTLTACKGEIDPPLPTGDDGMADGSTGDDSGSESSGGGESSTGEPPPAATFRVEVEEPCEWLDGSSAAQAGEVYVRATPLMCFVEPSEYCAVQDGATYVRGVPFVCDIERPGEPDVATITVTVEEPGPYAFEVDRVKYTDGMVTLRSVDCQYEVDQAVIDRGGQVDLPRVVGEQSGSGWNCGLE